LLRALVDCSVKTGREPKDALLTSLLGKLASVRATYTVPDARPGSMFQYVPKAGKDERTKNRDRFFVVDGPVYWHFPIDLDPEETALLDDLLRKMHYFGRMESLCRMSRMEGDAPPPNCELTLEPGRGRKPVLAWDCDIPFDMDRLTATSTMLKGYPIPPGGRQYYAILPTFPRRNKKPNVKFKATNTIRFFVSGKVLPRLRNYVDITEKIRSRALKNLYRAMGLSKDWAKMTPEQRDSVSLFTGKDAEGRPHKGNLSPYFLLEPYDSRRLLLTVHRKEPFNDKEIEALLECSNKRIVGGRWPLVLQPLPLSPSSPEKGRIWKSMTPFVLPREWHTHGKSTESLIRKHCRKVTGHEPVSVRIAENSLDAVRIHRKGGERGKPTAFGYLVEMEFEEPLEGHISLGDSSHFGLGLFRPEREVG